MRAILGVACAALIFGAPPADAEIFGLSGKIQDDLGQTIIASLPLIQISVPDDAIAQGAWSDQDAAFSEGPWTGSILLSLTFRDGQVGGGSIQFRDFEGNGFDASGPPSEWSGFYYNVLWTPPYFTQPCQRGCQIVDAGWTGIARDPDPLPEPPATPVLVLAMAALAAYRRLVG